MRHFFIFWLLLSAPFAIKAQQNSSVEFSLSISSFDFESEDENYSISIGTVITHTFQTGNFILSFGILQPFLRPCLEGKLSFYPNPVIDHMFIRYEGCQDRIIKLEVVDLNGKIIGTYIPDEEGRFNFNNIPIGILISRVYISSGDIFQFKILKTTP